MVIWTTTPWTIPGNRAISFINKIAYGLYRVTASPDGNWANVGDKFILADKLAADVFKVSKVESYERLAAVEPQNLKSMACAHPLHSLGYDFDVPLLDGDHVTDDTGTGFVHTAPGHGADDYIIWTKNQKALRDRGIDTTVPFTVDADGVLTKAAPGFEGKRVLKENGDKGDANDAVIKALQDAGNIIARGRLKHQYPHSWRSKKPVIFRNTPQWFIGMDEPLHFSLSPWGEAGAARAGEGAVKSAPISSPPPHPNPLPKGRGDNAPSLRQLALAEIKKTEWVPESGREPHHRHDRNRSPIGWCRASAPGACRSLCSATSKPMKCCRAMARTRRNRLNSCERIENAFAEKGADVWFEEGAKERFLKGIIPDAELPKWEQVKDVLDVWFDSGCTHAFTLEDPMALSGPQGSDAPRRRRPR